MVLLLIGMGSMLGYALTLFQVPQELGEILSAVAPGKGALPSLRTDQFLHYRHVHGHSTGSVDPDSDSDAIGHRARHRTDPFLASWSNATWRSTSRCPPLGGCPVSLPGAVGNTPLELVIKPILPMIAILTVTMLIITYVPEIAMYLPQLLKLVD